MGGWPDCNRGVTRTRPMASYSVPQNRAKRDPLEANATDRGARFIPSHTKSDVSADGTDLCWNRRDIGERVDSDFDTRLRLVASTIRNPARGGLS